MTVQTSFESRSPATGEFLARHRVDSSVAVDAAVRRARVAADWWAGLGFTDRRRRLLRWKHVLVRELDGIAELMHQETGKPVDDARLELVLAVDHLDWAAKHASQVLGLRRVPSGLLGFNLAASVRYLPFGVVGVIGPWNYPVFTPMGSIAYALAAGNAVVFKPSEFATGVGVRLVETFAEAVHEQPALQAVTGFGDTGAALCRSAVDKIGFTGSTATGKRVMAACAQSLTPVLIEAGGKDAAIVAADADLGAAAEAIAFGAMGNAGQTCVGIERAYVVDAVFDRFVERVAAIADRIRVGAEPQAQLGPITMPAQVSVIRRHIEDAIARGGRAVVGGPESVRPPFVHPVVLVDVPEDSEAITEETFGPVLVVNRVRTLDEAVDRANSSRYGLGSAVFAGRRTATALAHRLHAGMTSVNGVQSFATVPSLPFGGTRESGFGRIHGADGLREFARPQAIARQRFRSPANLLSFARTARDMRVPMLLTRSLHKRG
ncbi:aldehyde dehydrogenase family protein [Streptomyces sp. SID8499]|uniref:aldehyde dehydrogenase family protein n=1 Tax=Streptomyces sp. SID8499 TaxID=2706106 RepID=UPI0013C81B89|nr:aldehyde dehydrogenase family protein [Streptomyces sp. SID8499]NED37824.1 aldehyde dehydrogenase family protein [Streptomyces sp. SID8499]